MTPDVQVESKQCEVGRKGVWVNCQVSIPFYLVCGRVPESSVPW